MKMNSLLKSFALLALISAFSACNGGGSTEAAVEEQGDSTEVAAERKTAAVEEGPQIDPVAWADLQALIPKSAAGLPRTNADADNSGLGNVGFSHSLGVYEKDGRRVEIQIIDAGSRKMILSTLAPWFKQGSVDYKEKTGFEQTTEIQGFPAFERYSKDDFSGEVSVVIKNRFIVMISGSQLPIEDLRKVMEKLDLKKIASF